MRTLAWFAASVAALSFGCLDFDQFTAETAGSTTTSAGGSGLGGSGGAGGTGTAGGGVGGSGGQGGEGGAAWEPPATQPCFAGGAVSDSFTGPQLNWITRTGAVDYSGQTAVIAGDTQLELDRTLHGGVLADCHLQIDFVKADVGVVFAQFRDSANELANNLTFRIRNGKPEVQISPGSGNVPLVDATNLSSGVMRVGESAGTYFVATAASAAGPWTLRYQTSTVPGWLQSDGFLLIGIAAPGPGDTAIFDNLNLP